MSRRQDQKRTSKPVVELLRPDEVDADPSRQFRAGGMDSGWVAELAEVIRDGGTFKDRPVAFKDARGVYHLADGYHRHAASRLAGTSIDYHVYNGTARDAWLYALGANGAHGRRRDEQTVARVLAAAFADPELSQLTMRELAAVLHVSSSTVSRHRKENTGKVDPVKAAAGAAGGSQTAAKSAARAAETPTLFAGGHKDYLGRDVSAELAEEWERTSDEGWRIVCPAHIDGQPHPRNCAVCGGGSGVIVGVGGYYALPTPAQQKAASYGVQPPKPTDPLPLPGYAVRPGVYTPRSRRAANGNIEVLDAYGAVVPDDKQGVFLGAWQRDLLGVLMDAVSQLDKAVDMGKSRDTRHAVWLDLGEQMTELRASRNKLVAAIDATRGSIPYAVCRHCSGAGCEECRQSGVVTQQQTVFYPELYPALSK